MVDGMIDVKILLFVLTLMQIGKEVWMRGRAPVEEHSLLVED